MEKEVGMAEVIIDIIFLYLRMALSTWCIGDAIICFKKKEYYNFGFNVTITFMTWIWIVLDTFISPYSR